MKVSYDGSKKFVSACPWGKGDNKSRVNPGYSFTIRMSDSLGKIIKYELRITWNKKSEQWTKLRSHYARINTTEQNQGEISKKNR